MKSRTWLVFIGLVVLLISPVASPYPAYACICSSPSIEQALGDAETVFVGKVKAIELHQFQANFGGNVVTHTLQSAIFEVSSVIKGNVGARAIVSQTGGSCDENFQQGQRYLVFAGRFEYYYPFEPIYDTNSTPYGQRLSTSVCAGNTPLPAEIGQSGIREMDQNSWPTLLLTGATLTLAGVGLIVAWLKRRAGLRS